MRGPEQMSTSPPAGRRLLAGVLSGLILLAGPAAMAEEADVAADEATPSAT